MTKRLFGSLLFALAVLAALALHRRWGAASDDDVRAGARRDPGAVAFLDVEETDAHDAGAAAPRAPAAECVATVRGRVLDDEGRPLARAGIECGYPRAATLSDALGQFALELSLKQRDEVARVHLSARAAGRANRHWTEELRADRTVDLGDVVLAPGGALTGRVLDEAGRALHQAEVRASADVDVHATWRYHGPTESIALAATDAQGTFRLEGVPLSALRVWAGTPDSYWTSSEIVSLEGGAQVPEIVLRLAALVPADVIDLTVVAPDGTPLAGAQVSFFARAGKRTVSGTALADEGGRYRHLASVREPHEFRAADPRGRFRPARVENVAPGARGVELRLQEPRTFALAVRDQDGRSIEHFTARLVERDWGGDGAALAVDARAGAARPELPVAPFEVDVEAAGFRSASFGPFDPEQLGDELAVTLRALPGVRGTVRAGGAPLAGARVALYAASTASAAGANGELTRPQPTLVAETLSDERGAFTLPLDKDGSYTLLAQQPGFAPLVLAPLAFEAQSGARDLELELLVGGVLAGRARVAPGARADGLALLAMGGEFQSTVATTGADGSFRFEHLAPGEWSVGAAPEGAHAQDASRAIVCSVRDGETTVVDVPFFDGEPARLHASLRFDRDVASGWRAGVVELATPPREVAGATLDERGEFSLTALAPGDYTLHFFDDARGPQALWISTPLKLVAGDNERVFDIALGRAQGRVVSASAAGLMWRWQRDDGLYASGSVECDADGSFVVPRMPAGVVDFVRVVDGGEQQLERIDLPARATIDLDL